LKASKLLNARHVVVNLIGSLIPIVIILVSVPLFLRLIGAGKYGTLSIVWIVFGYFGILDLGVSRAVTNAVSRYRSDARAKAEIVWSACALNLFTGAFLASIAGIAYFVYVSYWPAAGFSEVARSVPLMMVGVPIVMITSSLNGALDGEEMFKAANILQVLGSALFQLVPLGVAAFVSTETHVLIDAVILCRAILLAGYVIVAVRVFRLLEIVAVTRRAVRDLLRFGSTVAVINIIDPIFSRIDQLIIAKFAGTEGVAAYNIAVNSIVRLSILPLAMSRSLFPKLSIGTLDDHRDELLAMKSRVILIWFGICLAALGACDIVFHVWLRNAIAPQVSDIAKIFIVGLWANCLSILPYTALQATGRSGTIIKAHLFEMPFYVAALVCLTWLYGALGAAAAYGFRNFIDYLILWKLCGFQLRRQIKFSAYFAVLSIGAAIAVNFHIDPGALATMLNGIWGR